MSNKELKNDIEKGLEIVGETTSIDQVAQYFPSQWKSNDIESMLDHREAEKALAKVRGGDMRWIAYVAVLLICASIAIYILMGVFGQGGSPIDVQGIADAAAQKVVTQQGTGLS